MNNDMTGPGHTRRMKWLELTLPAPGENLAADEALLDACEAGHGGDVLRFWEPRELFVVLGYANRASREVELAACRAQGVPVLRRCSGGGTVLQGPGCLNYTVVLRIAEAGPLATVTGANRFIMERHRAALALLIGEAVQVQGVTDLALGALKFSGNAQRRRRESLIFHGTFLLDFDLALVGKFLRFPSQQPAYRQGRAHEHFLTNLHLPADAVKTALRQAWRADAPLQEIPHAEIARLARDQYATEAWNLKFG